MPTPRAPRRSRQRADDQVAGAAVHIADVTDSRAVAACWRRRWRVRAPRHPGQQRRGARRDAVRRDAFEDWRRVLSIVLDGAFLCTQAALPHLVKPVEGRSSISAVSRLTRARMAARTSSPAKAGLAGLTRALAIDLAPHQITVNCVVPGTIETVRGLPAHPSARSTGARCPRRAPRRAGGDRRHGAHAVRPRHALCDRPVDPRERRQPHAMNRHSLSPLMSELSTYIARRRASRCRQPWPRRRSITFSTPSPRWCPGRDCSRAAWRFPM